MPGDPGRQEGVSSTRRSTASCRPPRLGKTRAASIRDRRPFRVKARTLDLAQIRPDRVNRGGGCDEIGHAFGIGVFRGRRVRGHRGLGHRFRCGARPRAEGRPRGATVRGRSDLAQIAAALHLRAGVERLDRRAGARLGPAAPEQPARRPEGQGRAAGASSSTSRGISSRAGAGRAQGYDWPEVEHGIYVDPKGFVWIGGNGQTDHHLVKFNKQAASS